LLSAYPFVVTGVKRKSSNLFSSPAPRGSVMYTPLLRPCQAKKIDPRSFARKKPKTDLPCLPPPVSRTKEAARVTNPLPGLMSCPVNDLHNGRSEPLPPFPPGQGRPSRSLPAKRCNLAGLQSTRWRLSRKTRDRFAPRNDTLSRPGLAGDLKAICGTAH
jgi:hypothetical protein